MSTSSEPIIHVDLTTSIGAVQIGNIFSIFLLGILTAQCYYYVISFWKTDGYLKKILVSLVWGLEVAHTGCSCYEVYFTTITLYGEPYKFSNFPVFGSTTATGEATTFLVQNFYAYRLALVLPRHYNLIGWICMALGVLRFVLSAYLTKFAMSVTTIGQYTTNQGWAISTIASLGAANDVTIALSMLWYLAKKRKESLERTTAVIDKLIEYTIRTGALTSIWAVVFLIMVHVEPLNWSWLAVYLVLAKLYSTTFLSFLNARVDMRQGQSNSRTVLPSFGRILKHPLGTDSSSSDTFHNTPKAISIEMNTTTQKTGDTPSSIRTDELYDQTYKVKKPLGA